jgi:Telomeric repeat-binding factor 2.
MGRLDKLPGFDESNTRRRNVVVGGVYALAGCVGLASLGGGGDENGSGSGDNEDSGGSDESGGETGTATEIQSQNEGEQSLTHEIGESFSVGDGAQSIEYTVNGASIIEDYIGSDADLGSTPDGTFVVVNLDLENIGDETLDISTNFLKLVDQEDRTFEADTEAGIYADQDSRVSADPITFDQLQPGLSVTRAVIFDVGPGTYRFAAEPAGAFSNADTHYVPLGEV